MKIALAQINPTVGDLRGNSRKIVDYARRASDAGAELVVFPELCVTGYPPLDLLENSYFIESTAQAVKWIAAHVPQHLGVIVGAPERNPAAIGKRLFNSAILLNGGVRAAHVYKTLLPTYDVFDEYRYFQPSPVREVVSWRGLRLALHICEDMWNNEEQVEYHAYERNPVDELAALGADLFINISASPFAVGRHRERNRIIGQICREHRIPFLFVNQVGCNTEIIFDGDSRVHGPDGELLCCAPSFEEALLVWEVGDRSGQGDERRDDVQDLHDALVLGIRDYFHKTGSFRGAVIGLSGGIDSAVTCALAVEALGPDAVVGLTMPSRYSSTGSVSDSEALAEALGIEFHTVPIEPAVTAFHEMLTELFAGTEPGIAEENIQARVRGLTLMAYSNKFGNLLLTTGNKSEMAVGYATLYGDMNGGLAVLSDVFKTQVYALARFINARVGRDVIPQNTITKAPSAELRPGQTDQDSLPPYDVLDEILRQYIEEKRELEEIAVRTGFDRGLVLDVLQRV
ncbi:MAG TPA: NAD+ synthase, partial [Rhodothermales bacterium]